MTEPRAINAVTTEAGVENGGCEAGILEAELPVSRAAKWSDMAASNVSAVCRGNATHEPLERSLSAESVSSAMREWLLVNGFMGAPQKYASFCQPMWKQRAG